MLGLFIFFLLFHTMRGYIIPHIHKLPSIHLLRHYQTEYNIKKINTGQLDIPILLDDTKHITLKDKYDMIFSSNLRRCKQTIDLLNLNNHKIIYDSQLIECGFGDLTNQKKDSNIYKRTLYNKPPNLNNKYISESIIECGIRSHKSIMNYIHKYNLQETHKILIVSHRNTLKGFYILYHLYNFYQIEPLENIELLNEDYINKINNIEKIYKIPTFNNMELVEL